MESSYDARFTIVTSKKFDKFINDGKVKLGEKKVDTTM
jgi:hypothetical protein